MDALKARVRGLLDSVPGKLSDGAKMPASTDALEAAYVAENYDDMYVLFLDFFMDMKLEYDMGDDDMCRPTAHACTDPDDEVTQMKLPELYLTARNLMEDVEPALKMRIWRLVVDKLCARVELGNEEFDEWVVKVLQSS
eukprot:CAMPEP_0113298584 /NCGR_PEP_ID=MMETSP0010_2-20120614/969_1 /TAXON_ID=216773 ORGANISM="Corethron hystrix, Strain 308" /NCGR_SAMPLE_ID=MMETSP0010_2 /ASSEMBLY_ACC=CAM_ASM_000155 /LENGTH=138 /DNA_ID=CAMNT_0000151665 /DNA_START=161 /DNA_END=577 /DNA_ORIENTATION=- /assembly_acc=CAM_ASM_000155